MAAEDFRKLIKASAMASKKSISTHYVLSINKDGKLHGSGTDNFMAVVFENEELFHGIKDNLLANVTKDNMDYANTHQLD